MSNPYDNQVGGNHYKKYEIQPSEFINKKYLLLSRRQRNQGLSKR